MTSLSELYSKRISDAKDLIRSSFNFNNTTTVPYIINNANYFSFGYPPEELSNDYYTDPGAMYRRQTEQFERHFELVEDYFVPYYMPWFGTGVLASGFGMDVSFQEKMDPAIDSNPSKYVVKNPDDVDRLTVPDPEKDGLMPKVLEQISYFKEYGNFPVGITDCQGPLTTLIQLLGYEKAFYWFYDYPKTIHTLMDIITEALITWIKAQKRYLEEPQTECAGDQGVWVPEGIGVWESDDDAILMPPKLFKEFVVPYNERPFKVFGGGILHYCGNANQQIENFLCMKYLRGINVFSLGDAPSLLELKKAVEGRLTIIACDFTPIGFEEYYENLFDSIGNSKTGLIIQSLFSPIVGVKDKKYELIKRDEEKTVKKLQKIFEKHLLS